MFFLFTFKNKEETNFVDFKKNSRIFKNLNFFTKLKTFKTHFLKFLSFINLPCGHVMSHKKIGPDRFSRFDVYWIKTNRHPNRQAKFIYRLSKPVKTVQISLKLNFCVNLYRVHNIKQCDNNYQKNVVVFFIFLFFRTPS